MKPIDFRNETFEAIQSRLVDLRRTVWEAWMQHGPGTTREVAKKSGIDILTFRPRTTELFQLGLVVLVDSVEKPVMSDKGDIATVVSIDCRGGSEGTYKARRFTEWQQWCAEEKTKATASQIQLL